MKNQLKRLMCLALILVLLLTYAPATASAAVYLEYRNIDVSRLNLYCESSDVTLEIFGGGLPQFRGKLRDITRQELDKLCQEVLDDMNKMAGEVVDSQKAYKRFEDLATKLDGMTYGDGALKSAILAVAGAVPGAGGIAGTVGSSGIGMLDDLKNGDGGWTSVAEKTGFGAAGIAAGLAYGPLGSIFVSLAQFGWDQYKLYDMKKELEKALRDSQLYLNYLNRLKRKIAEYKKKNNVRREIVFEKAKSSREFYFFDTKNWCQWELNMTLKLDESKIGIHGELTYTGDFKIFVMYNMSGFLSNPRDVYNTASNGACDAIDGLQIPFEKWTTSNFNNGGVAEIERTLTGKATAIVDVHGMVDFKFEQTDDLKATNIANVGFTLRAIMDNVPYLGKTWDAAADYEFISNYSGPSNPPIKIQGHGETRWWIHPTIGNHGREEWEAGNRRFIRDIVFDEQAWRPWDTPNPRAELRILGNSAR